jgi:hypothetical protein
MCRSWLLENDAAFLASSELSAMLAPNHYYANYYGGDICRAIALAGLSLEQLELEMCREEEAEGAELRSFPHAWHALRGTQRLHRALERGLQLGAHLWGEEGPRQLCGVFSLADALVEVALGGRKWCSRTSAHVRRPRAHTWQLAAFTAQVAQSLQQLLEACCAAVAAGATSRERVGALLDPAGLPRKLWEAVVSAGGAGCGPASAAVSAAAAGLMAGLHALGMGPLLPKELVVTALALPSLQRALCQKLLQLEGGAALLPAGVAEGLALPQRVQQQSVHFGAEACIGLMGEMVGRCPDLRLRMARSPMLLHCIEAMLQLPAGLGLAGTGLQLLELVASGLPDVQRQRLATAGLLQALVAQLAAGDQARQVAVLKLLRELASGNPAGQLAAAEAGAAVLVPLVVREDVVGEEALLTAAVLRGSARARALLAQAGERCSGELGA